MRTYALICALKCLASGVLTNAAVPIINSPLNGFNQYFRTNLGVSYVVSDTSPVVVTMVSTDPSFSGVIFNTSFVPAATNGHYGIPASVFTYASKGPFNLYISQSRLKSANVSGVLYGDPALLNYANVTACLPTNTDIDLEFQVGIDKPVTLAIYLNSMSIGSYTQSDLGGSLQTFLASFIIPKAAITTNGTLTAVVSQLESSATYIISIGNPVQNAITIVSPPAMYTGGGPLITYPLNQDLLITYTAPFSSQVQITHTLSNSDGSHPIYTDYSNPSQQGEVFVGEYTILATSLITPLIHKIQFQQTSPDGQGFATSPSYFYYFPGPPIITANSGTSTYFANQIASVKCSSVVPPLNNVYQFTLSNVDTDLSNTGYVQFDFGYPAPPVPGSIPFDLKISNSYAYPVAGNYSLTASANGFTSTPFTFTILNPPPPVISSPQNGTVLTLSATSDLNVTFTAPSNYLQPINFALVSGQNTLTTVATPTASGTGIATFSGAGRLPTGNYILTAQQITPDNSNTGTVTVKDLQLISVGKPVITNPQNGTIFSLNKAINVTYTSTANLEKPVTLTIKKPDNTLASLPDTPPPAGSNTVLFPAATFNQLGTYSMSIYQTIAPNNIVTGDPIIFSVANPPVLIGVVDGTSYTQDLVISPSIQIPTIAGLTTITVTLTYNNGEPQTQTYQLVDQNNGTSTAGPIELNRPFQFSGTNTDFAPVGQYSIVVTGNGITTEPVTYTIEAATAPSLIFPSISGQIVVVSTANPFNVTYNSPANYELLVTATLTPVSETRKVRRADPIIITSNPDLVGGGNIIFDQEVAITTSGLYTVQLSQATPDGDPVSSPPLDFEIQVLAASGGGNRRRRLARGLAKRSRCSNSMTECPTASGGFECLDIQNELTSCGGCNADEKAESEFDCTNIKHAKGVGCQQGRCIVFSCEGHSFEPNAARNACVKY